jgi:hypothetical protein
VDTGAEEGRDENIVVALQNYCGLRTALEVHENLFLLSLLIDV